MVTPTELRDRGYNLMMTAFLFVGGLAFGLSAISEGDLPDKIDDIAVLAIGVIALAWYRLGSSRFQRSWLPLLLVALTIASLVVGILIESGDRQSLSDNATGMWLYVPLLILGVWEYFRPFRVARLSPSDPEPLPMKQTV
jgi:hypothetical protein